MADKEKTEEEKSEEETIKASESIIRLIKSLRGQDKADLSDVIKYLNHLGKNFATLKVESMFMSRYICETGKADDFGEWLKEAAKEDGQEVKKDEA
jgi:hypothetical protein